MKKLSLILICTIWTVANIFWTITNMNAKQTELSDIKNKYAQLEESNRMLKLEMAILKNMIGAKPEADQPPQPSAPKAPAEDPIAKIEQRPDFAEFMELVNNLRYTNGCDTHPIMTVLKNNSKLRTYAWAIENVCNPETFFGKGKDGKGKYNLNPKMNQKQEEFINRLPATYSFTTLKQVKEEADRILQGLQKFN